MMIGCLRTRVRKQPIIALYFEFENEFQFYNLEARTILTCTTSEFTHLLSSQGNLVNSKSKDTEFLFRVTSSSNQNKYLIFYNKRISFSLFISKHNTPARVRIWDVSQIGKGQPINNKKLVSSFTVSTFGPMGPGTHLIPSQRVPLQTNESGTRVWYL